MKPLFRTLLTLLLLVQLSLRGEASSSGLVVIQGTLINAEMIPITKVVEMSFSFFSSSDRDELLWQETQRVSVESGRFSASLGANTLSQRERLSLIEVVYLDVEIGGERCVASVQLATKPPEDGFWGTDGFGSGLPWAITIGRLEVIDAPDEYSNELEDQSETASSELSAQESVPVGGGCLIINGGEVLLDQRYTTISAECSQGYAISGGYMATGGNSTRQCVPISSHRSASDSWTVIWAAPDESGCQFNRARTWVLCCPAPIQLERPKSCITKTNLG